MLKLVFRVEESTPDGKPVILVSEQQIEIKITEEELLAADVVDADKLKVANDLIGDCFANRSSHGRGKVLRETFAAIGIIVGKFLQRSLAARFGNEKTFELLDKKR